MSSILFTRSTAMQHHCKAMIWNSQLSCNNLFLVCVPSFCFLWQGPVSAILVTTKEVWYKVIRGIFNVNFTDYSKVPSIHIVIIQPKTCDMFPTCRLSTSFSALPVSVSTVFFLLWLIDWFLFATKENTKNKYNLQENNRPI